MDTINETVSSIHNGDDTFYEFISNAFDRIKTADVTDPEFWALASSIDYRLKYLATRGEVGERESTRIMQLCRSKGFIPQHQMSGVPAIKLGRIELSPDGKLVMNRDGFDSGRVDVFLTGDMRPIASIAPSEHIADCAFSPDSTMMAVLTYNGIQLWDLRTLSIAAEYGFGNDTEPHDVEWSGDGRRVFFGQDCELKLLEVSDGTIRTVWEECYEYAVNHDGSVVLQPNEDHFFLFGVDSDLGVTIPNPTGRDRDPFVFHTPEGFQVFTNGARVTIGEDGAVKEVRRAVHMDHRIHGMRGMRPGMELTSHVSFSDGEARFIVSDGIVGIEYVTDIDGNILRSHRASMNHHYEGAPVVSRFNPRNDILSYSPIASPESVYAFIMDSEIIVFREIGDNAFAYRVLRLPHGNMELSFIDPAMIKGYTDVPEPLPVTLKDRFQSIESRFKDRRAPMAFYESTEPVDFEPQWLSIWNESESYERDGFVLVRSGCMLHSHPGLEPVGTLEASEDVQDLFRSGDGDFVVTRSGSTYRLHLISEGELRPIRECTRRVRATMVGDRILLADGDDFRILDSSLETIWSVEPLSEKPWIPVNHDPLGNLCILRETMDDDGPVPSTDVEFATLRAPDYEIHTFEGDGFSLHMEHPLQDSYMDLAFNGRDVVVCDYSLSGANDTLTSYRVERTGLRRRKTARCDPHRRKPSLVPLSDGKYLTHVNVPSGSGTRAMIRLMEPSSGRRTAYASDAPEGQMQGPPDHLLEQDCRVEPFRDMVLMEMRREGTYVVVSVDPQTGRLHPPSGKGPVGRIHRITDEGVEVFMGDGRYDSIGIYDQRMNRVGSRPLDVPFGPHGHEMTRGFKTSRDHRIDSHAFMNPGRQRTVRSDVVDVTISPDWSTAHPVEPTLTPRKGWRGRRPVEVDATASILRNGMVVSKRRFPLELALSEDGHHNDDMYAMPVGDGFAIIQFQDFDQVNGDPLFQMRVFTDGREETVYDIVGYEHLRNPVIACGSELAYVVRTKDGYAIRTSGGDIPFKDVRPQLNGYGGGVTLFSVPGEWPMRAHYNGRISEVGRYQQIEYEFVGIEDGKRVFEAPYSRFTDRIRIGGDHAVQDAPCSAPVHADTIVEVGGYRVHVHHGIGVAVPSER